MCTRRVPKKPLSSSYEKFYKITDKLQDVPDENGKDFVDILVKATQADCRVAFTRAAKRRGVTLN